MKMNILRRFFLTFVGILTSFIIFGNISLPEIFNSHMVLQQKSDVKLWGWAKPGEVVHVSVSWSDKKHQVKTSNQGLWDVTLKTPEAGGPYKINLKGYNEINLSNVLIGEVWLCSGQSNMEWSASAGLVNKDEEIANADYPEIRFFTVYTASSHYPQEHCTGEWTECTPQTMQHFSAVAYFFARDLQKKLGVPVGLINSSWGGTPAEAWTPEDIIENDEFLKEAAAKQNPVPWGPVEPGRIYNAKISPLVPFRIAGALWYQGEQNVVNGYAYKELLTALITSWRQKWEYDFPFYFAQIAPYKYGKPFEGAIVRNEQRKTLTVPNTGMIVLSDVGDTFDIHPKNKQDVGLRFANLALKKHYKVLDEEVSGPLYAGFTVDKNKAVVKFDHATGLHTEGGDVSCFELAGADGVFYPAKAKIKEETVVVQSKYVKEPKAVRFAWSNTATPNLFNGAGLPTSCFISE